MPRKKREKGRPPSSYPLPPKADATADELVKAFFQAKTNDDLDFRLIYHCTGCEKQVKYPETLYRDGRCADCTVARRQRV